MLYQWRHLLVLNEEISKLMRYLKEIVTSAFKAGTYGCGSRVG